VALPLTTIDWSTTGAVPVCCTVCMVAGAGEGRIKGIVCSTDVGLVAVNNLLGMLVAATIDWSGKGSSVEGGFNPICGGLATEDHGGCPSCSGEDVPRSSTSRSSVGSARYTAPLEPLELVSCINVVRLAVPRLRRERRVQAIQRPARPAHNARVPSKKQNPKTAHWRPPELELEDPESAEKPSSTEKLRLSRPCIVGSVTLAEKASIPRMAACRRGIELLTEMPSIARVAACNWGDEPLTERPSIPRVTTCMGCTEPLKEKPSIPRIAACK